MFKYFLDNNGKDDTDQLHSDLEDFDLVDSDSSECESKSFAGVNKYQDSTSYIEESFHESSELQRGRPIHEFSEDHPQPTTEDKQTKFFIQKTIETKPKIWSLAQTATSFNQVSYSSCMHKSQETLCSTNCDSDTNRKQESPVATLRNWVDGVFHDPIFRHTNINQTLNTELWTEAISPENNYQEHSGPISSQQNV